MKIAFPLTLISCIIGITAAAKRDPELGVFPDTTWLWALSMACAALGVFLWRVDSIQKAKNDLHNSSGQFDPIELIRNAYDATMQVNSELLAFDLQALNQKSIQIIEDFFLPLEESRRLLLTRFGMKDGALLLSHLAFAERNLNRSVSAASDGHLPEAQRCFPLVLFGLTKCKEHLDLLLHESNTAS
jgi:hypothetical protein